MIRMQLIRLPANLVLLLFLSEMLLQTCSFSVNFGRFSLQPGASPSTATFCHQLRLPLSRKRVRSLAGFGTLRAARGRVEKELASSSKDGDAAAVGSCLSAGADPNGSDEWGSTCLHLAAKSGHAEVVEVLLDNGANVHLASHSDDETSPLHAAAFAGHAAVVDLLLQHNADVLRKDEFGSTPLQLAMKKKHQAVVELLKPSHGAKSEEESKEQRRKEDEDILRRQNLDAERPYATNSAGKAFTQSEAAELLEEGADWEASALGREGEGGSVVQMITDPKTGQKFFRRVPIKKGAEALFQTKRADAIKSAEDRPDTDAP